MNWREIWVVHPIEVYFSVFWSDQLWNWLASPNS
ncbi:unnamed protein product, partial [marine sediment metagenome]